MLLVLAAGCTTANPAFCPGGATCGGGVCDLVVNRCLVDTPGCAGREDDTRSCAADRSASGTCAGGALTTDRACPPDAPCHFGWCTPADEVACHRDADCGIGGVCSLFRAADGTLRPACAARFPSGHSGGASTTCGGTVTPDACRAGVCAGGRCFVACAGTDDCGGAASCATGAATVEGTTMSVAQCVP